MTPQQVKYTKIGIVVLVLGVGGYVIYNKFANDGNSIDPTGNGGVITSGGNNGNIYVFNAKKIATDLYDAMKEANLSHTNIVTILKNVNESQFGQVVTSFGRKSYNDITGNQYCFTPFCTLPLVGLVKWLYEELSDSDYQILKLKYPNYL